MRLGDLVSGLNATVTPASAADVRVCDITEDSRTVVPGSLFVARKGTKDDGRKYAADAVKAGAVAVLTDDPALSSLGAPIAACSDVSLCAARAAERFYGEPTSKLTGIAVTGTNGKTTTASLVWQMLNSLDVRCGLIGTVEIDDGVSVAPAVMTTPPAIELSRTMQVMVESGCAAFSMEASSHALDQKRVDALKFTIGIFTNLTGDHLDYHKTMERYADAKARLFEMLPESGVAVVNRDDPAHRTMIRSTRAKVVTCSLSEGADCRAVVHAMSIDGMDLSLTGPWGLFRARVPLIGEYNVMNVLQAVAAVWFTAQRTGPAALSAAQLQPILCSLRAPPGRLEPVTPDKRRSVKSTEAPAVYVDFAHTDDALRNVLSAVKKAMNGRGRLWAVFGCGGDKDRTKRPRMGRAAADLADFVVITSDNPRSEKPSAIVNEILAGVPESARSRVDVQVDRELAIAAAIGAAAPGDVIVLAGKGHETEQISAGPDGTLVKRHFDDREVAAKALADRAAKSVHKEERVTR